MLTSSDFFFVFKELTIISNSNHKLNTTAYSVCKQYLLYLAKLKDDAAAKPGFFVFTFQNFLSEPELDFPSCHRLYNDLRNEQSLHQQFIQENPNFSEDLQNHWDQLKTTTSLPSRLQVPDTLMHAGFNKPYQPLHDLSLFQPPISLEIVIDMLLSNSIELKGKALLNLAHHPGLTPQEVAYIQGRKGFHVIQQIVNDATLDNSLRYRALKIFAREGKVLFKNRYAIHRKLKDLNHMHHLDLDNICDLDFHNMLFNFLNTDNKNIATYALIALTYMHPKNFKEDHVLQLMDAMTSNVESKQIYAINCLFNLIRYHSDLIRIDQIIDKFIEVFQRSAHSFAKTAIVDILFFFTQDSFYFETVCQSEYIMQFIQLAQLKISENRSNRQTKYKNNALLIQALHNLIASNPDSLEDIPISQGLNIILDLFHLDLDLDDLEDIVKILSLVIKNDERHQAIMYERGSTSHLLTLLSSGIVSREAKCHIVIILANLCQDHPPTQALLVHEKAYLNMIDLWEDATEDDELLRSFAHAFQLIHQMSSLENELCGDPDIMQHVLKKLDSTLHKNAVHYILRLLMAAVNSNLSNQLKTMDIMPRLQAQLASNNINAVLALTIMKKLNNIDETDERKNILTPS